MARAGAKALGQDQACELPQREGGLGTVSQELGLTGTGQLQVPPWLAVCSVGAGSLCVWNWGLVAPQAQQQGAGTQASACEVAILGHHELVMRQGRGGGLWCPAERGDNERVALGEGPCAMILPAVCIWLLPGAGGWSWPVPSLHLEALGCRSRGSASPGPPLVLVPDAVHLQIVWLCPLRRPGFRSPSAPPASLALGHELCLPGLWQWPPAPPRPLHTFLQTTVRPTPSARQPSRRRLESHSPRSGPQVCLDPAHHHPDLLFTHRCPGRSFSPAGLLVVPHVCRRLPLRLCPGCARVGQALVPTTGPPPAALPLLRLLGAWTA